MTMWKKTQSFFVLNSFFCFSFEAEKSTDFVTAVTESQTSNSYVPPLCWVNGLQEIETYSREVGLISQSDDPHSSSFLSISGESVCLEMNEQARQILAYKITKCHYNMNQRPFPPNNSNTKIVEMGDDEATEAIYIEQVIADLPIHDFGIYTGFYQHIHYICESLSKSLWRSEIERTTGILVKTSEQVAERMSETAIIANDMKELYTRISEEEEIALQNRIKQQEEFGKEMEKLVSKISSSKAEVQAMISKVLEPAQEILRSVNDYTIMNSILGFLFSFNFIWMITYVFKSTRKARFFALTVSCMGISTEFAVHWIVMQSRLFSPMLNFWIPKIRCFAWGLEILLCFVFCFLYHFWEETKEHHFQPRSFQELPQGKNRRVINNAKSYAMCNSSEEFMESCFTEHSQHRDFLENRTIDYNSSLCYPLFYEREKERKASYCNAPYLMQASPLSSASSCEDDEREEDAEEEEFHQVKMELSHLLKKMEGIKQSRIRKRKRCRDDSERSIATDHKRVKID